MPSVSLHVDDTIVIESSHLEQLLVALQDRGYQVIGPRVRDNAIIYDTLTRTRELPIGYTDEQDGGSYRLKKRVDQAWFGYAVGAHSWKRYLHPPLIRLWQTRRKDGEMEISAEKQEKPKYAFFGVRSCELHAIAIQDHVFIRPDYTDPIYQSRRQDIFIVAVNCGQAGGTCFRVSMDTGPKVTGGFDLALTEIIEADRHDFIVQVGTALGAEMLQGIPYREANVGDIQQAAEIVADTAAHMGRSMDTANIKDLLFHNLEHPRWENVASRCLTCGNCTMVCPTCFCTTVEDTTDLVGESAERWRRWDSCFTMDFSYIYSGSIRSSAKSRYRQWMTHKLASWIGQFGTSGCVGCGRCITWCPVGIDITEEVRAIRESSSEPVTQAKKEDRHANT